MTLRAVLVTGLAALIATATLAAPGVARAQAAGGFASGSGDGAFSPRVPVSAFARPAAWLDPTRMHLSTTVTVGSGWGGRTAALQVTSFSYQVARPLAMSLSVGNSLGTGAGGGNGFFLEGLSLAYHPHPSLQINVDYRDLRSPLQYSNYRAFGPIAR